MARHEPERCEWFMAGGEGFEPSNGGFKGRCLTTWRPPNADTDDISFYTVSISRNSEATCSCAYTIAQILPHNCMITPEHDSPEAEDSPHENPEHIDCVALIRQANRIFGEELDQLLRESPGHWVAYHGKTQLGVASVKQDLLQSCYAQGLSDNEIFIARIQPVEPIQVTWGYHQSQD